MDSNLSRKEMAYFSAAKAMATLSEHKQQLGCVVVDGHKIISSGHNSRTKNHTMQAAIDKNFFNAMIVKGLCTRS